ncbi:MAG: hypothetical protein JETT_3013 [Candidatus Jettenia ecosi]|uniref:Uncharacterized protein n=1 Tax=Candidatus Jettenia ecosi TaxID=2494326 RepID=A0A533QJI4_9BACT|nr:MAG: hypothetical protein JETT_3013 [Candidatus Jettenia ecosi]
MINVRILFEKILYPFGMRLALLAFSFCFEKIVRYFNNFSRCMLLYSLINLH